jgi:TfoX/Sxy family transcriptional regulator of competence genes
MAVSDSYLAFVLEQLGGVRALVTKRMFGGVGIYSGDVFFAVIDNDTIFFKVDDELAARYREAGMPPFAPMPDKPPMMSYYQVPPDVLEDAEEMVKWAKESIVRASTKKARKSVQRSKGPAAPKPLAKAGPKAAAENRLDGFIAKFDPKNQVLIRAVRKALRRRFPGAFELCYDNYNFFVLGYGPTERPSDCIISMAAGANGVGLCFIHGAKLKDPRKVLLGSGKQTRFIRLDSVKVLARPEVRTLIDAAVAMAKKRMPATGPVTLIIRSVSAKQRPRRKRE